MYKLELLENQMKKIILTLCALLFINQTLYSAESLNKILAIVGSIIITENDYEFAEIKYKKLQKFFPKSNKNKDSMRSQVLDFLIGRAILDITAEEETIQVNEKRVELEIQKRMEIMNITSREQFEKIVAAQTGMPFDLYQSEIPFQVKKSQVMQLRINVPMPTEKEIQSWYNANKNKIGFEFKYREIVMVPKNNSSAEELRINNQMMDIYKELKKSSASFNSIASSSKNQSSNRAGVVDWTPAFEVFNSSKLTASIVASLPNNGISEVYRDEKGRYCIVRSEGKRPTPLVAVRRGIIGMLQREKEENVYDNWLNQRRNEIPIMIYDESYNKEKNLPMPEMKFQYKE